MKPKALLLALFTAGIAVSIAVAASSAAIGKGGPNPGAPTTGDTSTGTTSTDTSTESLRGHGKADDRGKAKGHEKQACRPSRKLVLHGVFVAAGAGGFAMTVGRGNHGAKAFKDKQVTVLVDEKTRFHGRKHALAELAAGDRLVVQAFACKADAAAGSLLARKVGVKAAKGDEEGEDGTTTAGPTSTAPTTDS